MYLYVPEIDKIYYRNVEEKENLEEPDTSCPTIKKMRYEFKEFGSRYHQLTNFLKEEERRR
jgi:hypothetical protein